MNQFKLEKNRYPMDESSLRSAEKVDYKRICHRLEACVDEAITMLQEISHPNAKAVALYLTHALQDAENEIIKEEAKIHTFPTQDTSQ